MNPLDKQISRLPEQYRTGVDTFVLEIGVQAINAMRSCFHQNGVEAVRNWIKKKMTAQQRDAVLALVAVGETTSTFGVMVHGFGGLLSQQRS